MNWSRRIGMFLLVNIAVVVTLSLLMHVLNIQPYLTRNGLDTRALLIFCLFWGMGGAFISLAMSRQMAKWMMGVRLVDSTTRDPSLQELVTVVHSLSKKAGLETMPEVGVYHSPEVNAFATGPTRARSLVAVSSGLLHRMSKEEIEGVLGHEVAHIANGDMVTMTLLQGVVNAFVMFLARAIAFAMTRGDDRREGESSSPFAYYMTVFVLEMVLMALGTLVIAAFSRYREFRADAGSAQIAGCDKMVAALQRLKMTYEVKDSKTESAAFQSLKISNGSSGFLSLFSTHPPLEERIKRLQGFSS